MHCILLQSILHRPFHTFLYLRTFNFIGKVVAEQLWSILQNRTTLIALPQVGVAVHHYLLISHCVIECSVSWNTWYVECCLVPNGPHYSQHILHPIILTPEGDVASFTHIRGSWVGLSEDHWTCNDSEQLQFTLLFKQAGTKTLTS